MCEEMLGRCADCGSGRTFAETQKREALILEVLLEADRIEYSSRREGKIE